LRVQPGAQNPNPPMTVTRRIRRRGEHGISRKTIVQGMPGCSDCTCMLVCACYVHFCTRDRGCSKHPAFPAPSSYGRNDLQSPGETRRGNAEVCLCIVIASGAKQSISPRKERMDCFASLAMTISRHALKSRGAMRPRFAFISRPKQGRGECRVPDAPAVSCAIVVVERTRVTTSTPERPAFPHAMVLRLMSGSPR
jgi:hypothetical protein